MPIIEPAAARGFATEWVEAWNSHDIERILRHYTDDVEFSSPFVVTIAGEATGTLRGKAALRSYWTRALAGLPDLHFTLLDVLAGVSAVTLHYRGHRGPVAETFHLDASGQVRASLACYSVLPPSTETTS